MGNANCLFNLNDRKIFSVDWEGKEFWVWDMIIHNRIGGTNIDKCVPESALLFSSLSPSRGHNTLVLFFSLDPPCVSISSPHHVLISRSAFLSSAGPSLTSPLSFARSIPTLAILRSGFGLNLPHSQYHATAPAA